MGEPRGRDAGRGEPNSKGHVTRDPPLCQPGNNRAEQGGWGGGSWRRALSGTAQLGFLIVTVVTQGSTRDKAAESCTRTPVQVEPGRRSEPLGLHRCLSCQVAPASLRPHEREHTRPPRPSLFPGVCPSSCPLSLWCHPAVSPSAALLSLLLLWFHMFICTRMKHVRMLYMHVQQDSSEL